MRGEFDDQLNGPFRGYVTIQLLNQEEDKDYVVKVSDFTDHTPDDVASRVTKGELNTGWGHHKFLPHTDLEPKYLKNDCLEFSISKVVLTVQ